MTLPNAISLARLLAVPIIVWLIVQGLYAAAFWAIVAAGISDAADGFLARRYRWCSVLGQHLDSAADKALLVGVFLALGYVGVVPAWLVVLVVLRDLAVVGGALTAVVADSGMTLRPMAVGKVNTVAQIALSLLVLAELGFGLQTAPAVHVAMLLVVSTILLSGAGYVLRWARSDRSPGGVS